jgi:ubiquinone/menaquinone biosynthesis C-methylase UbiE
LPLTIFAKPWLWMLLGAAALAGLLAWETLVCEGAHLGKHFVVWLYDLTATRYESIKGFDRSWERRFLGEPLAAALGSLSDPHVLDVGAGTGRLVWALQDLLREPALLICLEASSRMMKLGLQAPLSVPAEWVQGWADSLPFPSGSFDAVVSLEMLEFTPQPRRTMREMVRVLRPGGWLLVTNRVGRSARWIFGHTTRRADFPQWLESQGLTGVEVLPWQVEYDLAWARKPLHAAKPAPEG